MYAVMTGRKKNDRRECKLNKKCRGNDDNRGEFPPILPRFVDTMCNETLARVCVTVIVSLTVQIDNL